MHEKTHPKQTKNKETKKPQLIDLVSDIKTQFENST